ncbi:MAG: YkvA family protein [Proteobacteria bacterium]|nr:YkvA family protein [Pseudomonadota bacterium]MDA1289574.1 YkvA family protein [Pseudomonadota bacterium]
MSIDITFTLHNEDLKRFEDIILKTKDTLETEHGKQQVELAAMEMLKQARATNLPRFIEERFAKLELLINMVGDTEWELDDKEQKTILSALAYFCDPEDLIPDHLPAIEYLDDAIYVEIITQELSAEISSYEEFFTYRVAEENRRKNRGLDTTVGREDWLADKRSVLHSRMRSRRSGSSSGAGWRTRVF